MKLPAQQSEQNMKTNMRIIEQPVEAKTQPPNIQPRINVRWLKLWRAVYPNTPPPREVQSPRSKVQRPADQIPAAVRPIGVGCDRL
jgi:hypothetical protein